MLGDRKTVVLRGGAPWGFRLSGGGPTPIYIAKVRSRSKAALGGLAAGDSIISINGISALQQSLREVNDIIDTIRDQLVIEVQSTTASRSYRLDSGSSADTRENSPIRPLITRITSQPKPMDHYQYSSARTTPTYPSYSNYSEQLNAYGRTANSPLSSVFRTATITTNSPSTPLATARVQQFSNYRPLTSNNVYDTPRSYQDTFSSGYASDTNEVRRSSISIRPMSRTATAQFQSFTQPQPQSQRPKVTVTTEKNYFSDSECVTSGPRYYKISREVNTVRRPNNVVLPIRSMTSKAYEQYIPSPEPPKVQQQQPPFDVYRYQQEQERERQEQLQRQAAASRYNPLPKVSFPSQPANHHEIGTELLKPSIVNKKRYADSSFFKTPYQTYPTVEEQKKMAHQIAAVLEGGDPSQRGATKFEKQRQRAEKYTLDSDATAYRPLRPLQANESSYSPYHSSNTPNFVKNSFEEAQYINPLRYVGAPEEFKQMHMQEHVTHTSVPPQLSVNLGADLGFSQGKGAALFQKRKARADKWVIDENNVKKPVYPPAAPYVPAPTNPWSPRAPSWSDSEGPSNSPVRNIPSPSPVSLLSPSPVQNGPRFGDFNAKPKGFGTWSTDNQASRGSVDGRKQINLNIEPSIREGIAESHTRTSSQPWSPSYNSPSTYPSNFQPTHFNYPPAQHNGTSNRYSAPQQQQYHFTDL